MPTTTKGLQPQKTSTQEAANVASKGQPAQGMGPLLGAGGGSLSTADKAGAKSGTVEMGCGDPVNALTGDVIDEATDIELPGVIQFSISRNYSTVFRNQPSLLGLGGWVLNLEQWIEATDSGLRYREADGRYLAFPSIAPGSGVYVRARRYQIDCTNRDTYRLTEVETRIVREFSTTPGSKLARLRRIVDARLNHIDLYYEAGRLTEVVDTAKRRLVFSNDAQGRITQVEVIAEGQAQTRVIYGYHADGELAFVEDALGHRQKFEYDGAHRLIKKTLKNGVSFNYRYDNETGKCIKTWGDGGLHEYEFIRERKSDHILVTIIGTEEPRTAKFNFAGDLLEEATFDRVFVQSKSYDDDHYVLSESNAAGETTRYEYDERGNRTKIIDPATNVTSWEYEEDRPARLLSPDGLETRFWYNELGDLAGVRYPTGAEAGFEYDEYGRLSHIFGGNGTLARYVYDGQHSIVEEHDERGAVWRYTYDPLGRPLTRTDPLGAVTRVEYDAMGQVLRVSHPDGSVTESAYDPAGNVVQYVDPQGQVTQMRYMGTGSLISQRTPDGSEWKFEYDTMERLRSIRNPKAETYRFFYDRAGRVECEETFDGRELRYTYDTSGRLLRLQQADQTYRRFRYDPLGNLIEDDSPHGAQKFERDSLGRLLAARVADGPEEIRVAFTRDRFGRITQEQQGEHLIEYGFDAMGRRCSRTVPGCGTTKYHYDVASTISRIEHEAPGGATQELVLDRDILGREIARRSGDGHVQIELNYDSMDRLIEQKIQAPKRPGEAAQRLLSERRWRYDLAGRVQQLDDSRWGTTHYQYDQLGQLMSARRGKLHEAFEYQANGSLVRALNELVPEDSVAGPNRWDIGKGNMLRSTDRFEYSYDRCHRRTAKIDRKTGERTEYVWDCRDRLREVQLPDGRRARYFYDAFGRRVRKEVMPDPRAAIAKLEALSEPVETETVASEITPENAFGSSLLETLQQLADVGQEVAPKITYFLWDGDELAAELDSETGPRGHVHYPGTFVPLLQIQDGQILVVVTDHLGTPRDLIGDDGTLRWSASYTAWGKIHEQYVAKSQSPRGPPLPASTLAVCSPFRFLGQYYDEETGLCSTRYRVWEADTGRWLSPDPLGIVGSENQLGLDGPPTTHVDPKGLAPMCRKAAARLTNEEMQKIVERIHRAEFGNKGKGIPIALTITKDGRVVVSQVGRVPGPKARAEAQKIFAEVEFVRGTTRGNATTGSPTGRDHAEARAIQYLGDEARGARQACTHYACGDCETRQQGAGVINVTGNASQQGGVSRPFII